MSIQINGSIFSGSVKLGKVPGPFAGQTTTYSQNVAGESTNVGFFFRPNMSGSAPLFSDIQLGWYVTGNSTWIVTDIALIDSDQSYLITISNGTFLSGVSYSFTGI